MLFECKVMRAGDDPHEWEHVAGFGWYRGEEAWNNDGPAIDADCSANAALAAIRMAVDMRWDIGSVDGLAHVCVVVRDGAECFMVQARVRTVIEPTKAQVVPQ
jgi:hypothetical protein